MFFDLQGIWTGVVGVVGLVLTLVVVRGGLEGGRLAVWWKDFRFDMFSGTFGGLVGID